MDNTRTTDSIMAYFTKSVEDKQPIGAHEWLDGAMYLSILVQGEQEKYNEQQQQVAILRKTLLEDGKTVAFAKVMVEATEEYKQMLNQKVKIDRINQFIMLSKINSRLSSDIQKGQL